MGSVDTSGFLKDSVDVVFGKIEKMPNNPGLYTFYDLDGKEVATILKDGTVRDVHGMVLFTVRAADGKGYCKVYNTARRVTGLVHQNYLHSGVCLMQTTKQATGPKNYKIALQEKP